VTRRLPRRPGRATESTTETTAATRSEECTGFALAAIANYEIRRALADPEAPSVSWRMPDLDRIGERDRPVHVGLGWDVDLHDQLAAVMRTHLSHGEPSTASQPGSGWSPPPGAAGDRHPSMPTDPQAFAEAARARRS